MIIMGKIKLKGFEKSQNTEEYNRLLKVTGGPESPYSLEEQPINQEAQKDLRQRSVEKLGIKRGYYGEQRRLEVGEKIARDRGCI